MRSGFLFLLIVLATAGGCSANHNSIYRHKNLGTGGATITFSDAKQRAIITQPQTPTVRMCTEPSPDVFSVFAQSLSAGGEFGQSGSKQIEAAASFALATAEQGATIQRTQTINLLKEVMYRTCERYLNGQIGASELAIQAVRDQRLIISALAIEQLTGVATPGTVIIGARGGGTTGSPSGSSVAVIAAAQKKRSDTEAAYKLLEDTAPSCTDVGKLTAAELADTANSAKKKKKADCEAAADARTRAAQDLATLERAAGDGGVPVTVSSDLFGTVGQPLNNRADATSIKEVASAIENIVLENLDQDEFLLFCMRSLDGNVIVEPDIKNACIIHIQTGIRTETLRSQADAQEFEAVLDRAFIQTSNVFDEFWSKVVADNDSQQVNVAKLTAIIDKFLNDNPSFFRRSQVESMRGMIRRQDMFELFRTLTVDTQTALAAAQP